MNLMNACLMQIYQVSPGLNLNWPHIAKRQKWTSSRGVNKNSIIEKQIYFMLIAAMILC